MSTTYYQLFNGKRRLITAILIVLTLVAFFLPFVDVLFAGDQVSQVTGFEMLLGQRGYTIIKEMGLDNGLTRKQLGDFSVFLGYVIIPLASVLIPVVAMLLGLYFIKQNTRGAAILAAVMMLVSLVFYHFSMQSYDDQRLSTMRVIKRYAGEAANVATQFVLNESPKLDTLEGQEKADLQAKIDAYNHQGKVMNDYLAFLAGKVKNWEYVSVDTDVQDKAKMERAAQEEDAHNASMKFEYSKMLGLNTVDILKILMALSMIAAIVAALGPYKPGLSRK